MAVAAGLGDRRRIWRNADWMAWMAALATVGDRRCGTRQPTIANSGASVGPTAASGASESGRAAASSSPGAAAGRRRNCRRRTARAAARTSPRAPRRNAVPLRRRRPPPPWWRSAACSWLFMSPEVVQPINDSTTPRLLGLVVEHPFAGPAWPDCIASWRACRIRAVIERLGPCLARRRAGARRAKAGRSSRI